jgi:multicomponent K+:H+ antiporter subunit E
MSRWLPHPILVVSLVLVWALLWNSFAPGVLLLGLVLALAITWWTQSFWPDRPSFHRPAVLLRFIPLVLWDIVIANLTVARLILGPTRKLRPAFLAIPVDLQDPYAAVALASIITLTPGTVSSKFSQDRRTLYVHALDVEDAEEEVRKIKQRYEAPLKEIFECSPSR